MNQDKSKISQPFAKIIYNENTCTQKLIEWMKKVNGEKNLGFGDIVFDTSSDLDGERPDAIIFEYPQTQNVLCLIEFKIPSIDHTSFKVIEKAHNEAKRRRAKYFATSNFKELIWFDTEDGREIDWFSLSTIENLDLIEDIRYKSQITSALDKFLTRLYEIHTGKIARPRRNIDELLIYYIQQKVDLLSNIYPAIIRDKVHKDKAFARDLRKWFAEQNWERSDDPEKDYRQSARQAAYLLVNKILFYNALQTRLPEQLDKLEIPESLTKGGRLQHTLQGYFNDVLKIDYETIYTTDFIDQIAFPENRAIVETIKELVVFLNQYDFAKIGVDIIGRIFERLIPEKERHNLGQFFTNPDIVDIILRFCLRHENDKVFDPSCGTGTFLVRAYQHKKLMNQRLSHEEILKTLWGTDIAKFPAHLATINLAINDLSVKENYPYILQEDFFTLTLGARYKEYERQRLKEVAGLDNTKIKIPYPTVVDCIVGNPPYTRSHEKESEAWGIDKEFLIKRATYDANGEKLADIKGHAGIYTYFFTHGFKFLQNGGRFGFIVSNSWLNTDYGAGLQEFFLKNAKIIAIIESTAERWFRDAEINTCIIILEKCMDAKERDQNLVCFVQLKRKISQLIHTPVSDMWDKKKERLDEIDNLINTIRAHNTYYENDDLRIFPKNQSELYKEGLGSDKKTYIGSKWEPYVYAPKIFFTVLEKAKDKFIPLRLLAEVNEGKPTGAEDFFFVKKETAKRYKIERRYLKPGLMKPRGNNYFELRPECLDRFFLTVNKEKKKLKGTGVLDYIIYGERQKLDKRKTFAKKPVWYQFEARKPAELVLSRGIGDRFYCTVNTANAICSGSFTEIRLNSKKYQEAIWTFFNSALGWLIIELYGRRGMGGGMLKVDPTDIRKMMVIDPKYFKGHIFPRVKKLLKRPVETIEKECGAEDRRVLDKLIMGDILGLTDDEQSEVYRTLIDLVKSRLSKAKSIGNKGNPRNGVDMQKALEELRGEIDNLKE